MREALVIGGGLAGSTLASRLCEAGRDAQLVEREAGPHNKVCGDFLSHEALTYLERLDIDVRGLGAVPIERMRIGQGERVAEAALPFPAMSVSRRRLDEAVLGRAAERGAQVCRGQRVTALSPNESAEGGWRASLANGETFRARSVFLATGKHDLRGHGRGPGGHDGLVGFKAHFQLSKPEQRALEGYVEIGLFRGGYAGLSLVEEQRANLCLLIERDHLRALGSKWDAVLAAVCAGSRLLRTRLKSATQIEERPLAVASIPYGYSFGSQPAPAPQNFWRVGDQAAVIPSFSGDGMSIALHSAALAAKLYLAGANQQLFHRTLADDISKSMRVALPLSRMLVHPGSQALAVRLASWLPGSMTALARHTRIPDPAVKRTRASQQPLAPSP